MIETTPTKDKPVVLYRGAAQIVHRDDGTRYAILYSLNHPKLGMCETRTSFIEYITDYGVIETKNTIYQPSEDEYSA